MVTQQEREKPESPPAHGSLQLSDDVLRGGRSYQGEEMDVTTPYVFEVNEYEVTSSV